MSMASFIFESISKASSLPVPTAPYVKHSETSKEAAEAIEPKVSALQGMVLKYIQSKGLLGATDQEVQTALGMTGNTQRPRRRELEIMRLIVDTKITRKSASGRNATVWIAKEFAHV